MSTNLKWHKTLKNKHVKRQGTFILNVIISFDGSEILMVLMVLNHTVANIYLHKF